MRVKAKAHPNIALIKYWGKREQKMNLPAVGSISITLQEMETVSTVEFQPNLKEDILILNGKKAKPAETQRVSNFLDLIRVPLMKVNRVIPDINSSSETNHG